MEARELRIGNLVNYNRFHNWEITASDIEACESLESQFEPIPLTEEWLLKFGFEEVDKKLFQNEIFHLSIRKANGFYMSYVLPEIKYVHQLQNLYYALTNQELEIK